MILQPSASDDPLATPLSRVLLVGLDGATFDVLDPLMDEGRMPNLKSIIDDGASGILESTRPPITPAAWTTFMTGKGPGKHGIIDFLRYDPARNQLVFNDNQRIRQKTLWQILSDKHYTVGSIHVPMTFPPEPVNGFMVSGFDTPPGQNFTYPPDLQTEIITRYPDYTHEKRWQRRALGGDALFAENLEYINQSFERGYELARFCGDRYGWDVLMVLFKLVDNLQHKAWRHLDPRTRHLEPRRTRLTLDCFARLDQVLGKLRRFASEKQATLMIMSDHGHGSLDGKVQPNLLLAEWGYLALRSRVAQVQARTAIWWERLTRSRNGLHAAPLPSMDRDLAFDPSRTRACVLHAGIYGFLYINLKGRQPGGVVEPRDYESLREEIRQRLLKVTTPDRDGRTIRAFSDVYVTEDLYNCSREEHPWMPDLLLAPAPGLAVVKKIRGRSPVRWVPLDRLEGTHRLEGVFAACGPAIAPSTRLSAHIADIAPTILAGLGERVPQDMDGRVLRELFKLPVSVRYEPPKERKLDEAAAPVLDKAQIQEVANRLGDLGYLD